MRKRGFIREPVKRAALILLAAIMITAGTGCAATSQKGGNTVSEHEENKKDEQAVSAGEGSSMKNGVEYAAEEGGTAAGAAETTAQEKENAGGEKKAEKTPETDLLQEIPENPVQNDDGSVTMDVFAMDKGVWCAVGLSAAAAGISAVWNGMAEPALMAMIGRAK